jgi:hypothetical protein
MDATHFRSPNHEVVTTTDPAIAERLVALGHRPLDPRTAAAVARSGQAIIDWPGSLADLTALEAIRAAAKLAPDVLHIRLGHVPQDKSVEAASDRELVAAITYARGLAAAVD